MDFMEVLEGRRSIRKFFPKPIEMEKIGALVTAGGKAPSVGDLQPWKFIVVTKARQLQDIADACPYERWLYQAPLVIVVCSLTGKAEQYYPGKGKLWAAHSCAAASENILLTAVELELSGCWVSSFESDRIRELLHIPGDVDPEIILAIGYPDESPPAKRTLPTNVTVYFNDYGASNVDVQLFKKNYGEYFRGRIEDLRTRAAYETADRGNLRMQIDKAQEKVKRFFNRKGKGGGDTHGGAHGGHAGESHGGEHGHGKH